MPYIPHTPKETQEMLRSIGLDSLEELFSSIPQNIVLSQPPSIGKGLDEQDTFRILKQASQKNVSLEKVLSFLGAGVYEHFIPASLKHIISRSEFYTAYTPYQAEASQGTLQALFEYQSFICALTGMDVTCASLYEGASSLAEAVLLAYRVNPKRKVFLPSNIHPHYIETVRTYLENLDFMDIVEVPFDKSGRTDIDFLEKYLDSDSCCLVFGYPNFFGVIEDIKPLVDVAQKNQVLTISVCNPLSLSILEPPGHKGVDICCGDGQSLGQDMHLGGNTFGFLSAKGRFLRKMPGRIIGKTKDSEGNQGFVLTLQAREQHIRREKATSNICSNQTLNALAACVYLALLGKEGFLKVGLMSLNHAHYLKEKLLEIDNIQDVFGRDFFNEFVIRITGKPLDLVWERLLERGIVAGLKLKEFYPQLSDCLLICATETKTKEDLDRFVNAFEEVLNEA